MTSRDSFSAIERLPRELQFEILSFLPHPRCLKAAALSSPSLCTCVIADQSRLSRQTLLNHVGIELIHDALSVFELATLPNHEWTKENALDAFSRYIQYDKCLKPSISTLKDALAISRLHDCVLYFTNDFLVRALEAKQVLPIDGNYGPFPGSSTVSRNEFARIQRSFYRWNIFCYLFGEVRKPLIGLENCATVFEIFFSRFAPWENEQLACIFDYLNKVLTPIFNYIVDHSTGWLKFLGISGNTRHLAVQYQALKGLERVQKILTASPAKLEDSQFFGYKAGDCHFGNAFWIKLAYRSAHDEGEYDLELKYCEEDDEKLMIKPAAFSDPDPGPERIWRWAHYSDSAEAWALGRSQKPLRERGYVMWDLARLKEWDRFQENWVWQDQYETLKELQRQKHEATEAIQSRASQYTRI